MASLDIRTDHPGAFRSKPLRVLHPDTDTRSRDNGDLILQLAPFAGTIHKFPIAAANPIRRAAPPVLFATSGKKLRNVGGTLVSRLFFAHSFQIRHLRCLPHS